MMGAVGGSVAVEAGGTNTTGAVLAFRGGFVWGSSLRLFPTPNLQRVQVLSGLRDCLVEIVCSPNIGSMSYKVDDPYSLLVGRPWPAPDVGAGFVRLQSGNPCE
jgi:hypothetical protein